MLSGAAGAYSGKIPFCAPISRYRRGLLRQNPYLRPDIPVSMGLITAKSLSTPRYPASDGAYYCKIPFCAPMYKGGGYNRPDFVSHTRFRKFCWVQIACFCLPYPRQHKYIKILTGRCLRCPSVFCLSIFISSSVCYSRFAFTSSNSCSISSEGALVARLTAMIAISPSPKPTTREYNPVALPRVCPPTRGM